MKFGLVSIYIVIEPVKFEEGALQLFECYKCNSSETALVKISVSSVTIRMVPFKHRCN